MEKQLYHHIADAIQALEYCKDTNNTAWIDNHASALQKMIDCLPHGSGINGNWNISYKYRNGIKSYALANTFDCMDENGFYDKYVHFRVTVSPSWSEIDVTINGKFTRKYEHIREYLGDILYDALSEYHDSNKFYADNWYSADFHNK